MTRGRLRLLGYLFAIGAMTPAFAMAATCGTGPNPVLVTDTALAFGLYSPGSSTPTDTSGTVTVSCTIALNSTLPNFTVALSAGGSGQFSPRQMSFLTNRLNYNLYTGASHGTIWGDGTSPTVTETYTSSSGLSSAPFTVFGRINPNQFASPGLYTDAITVTVTY